MTGSAASWGSPAVEGRRLRAPAKINLGLRLLGARDDGYHTLESVFVPIELWDDLEIETRPGERLIDLEVLIGSSSEAGPLAQALSDVGAGPDNLVVRAAEAFCKETGFDARIGIRLTKRIPAGAGLGGGSSDAAAVLLGLASIYASLHDHEIDSNRLRALALGLGADVPFFLSSTPALVTGIGEEIEPLDGIAPFDLVVANPGISLATAEVFRAADALGAALTDVRPGSTMRAISRMRGETGDLAPALGDLLINDLEPAARRLCPPVARLIDRLRETGAAGVSMSGSGATVFGVYDSREASNRAAEALRASESKDCWIQVTRIITKN